MTNQELEQQVRQLRDALEKLRDIQNGPPLISYTAEWNEAMRLADAFLSLSPVPAPDGNIIQAEADKTPSSRDWSEDFSHENGNYFNTCCECHRTFMGHKRRVVCKVCAVPAPDARAKAVEAVVAVARKMNRYMNDDTKPAGFDVILELDDELTEALANLDFIVDHSADGEVQGG